VLVGLPELIVKGPGERGKRKAKMIWLRISEIRNLELGKCFGRLVRFYHSVAGLVSTVGLEESAAGKYLQQ